MAFELIWSPTAKFDLRDIALFIAEDNASAAEQFVRSLFQVVEQLADFPESGEKRYRLLCTDLDTRVHIRKK